MRHPSEGAVVLHGATVTINAVFLVFMILSLAEPPAEKGNPELGVALAMLWIALNLASAIVAVSRELDA